MRYLGSELFKACAESNHKNCIGREIALIDCYVDCSCVCHREGDEAQEARECAGADDERRRTQFHADVKAIFGGPF